MEPIFELRNLKKHYPVLGGILRKEVAAVRALDGVDLDIYRGERLSIVGESGCGKTTLGKTMIRLFKPTSGNIYFHFKNGQAQKIDIAAKKKSVLKKTGIRSKLQMVFQDPTNSLDPRMLVKHIVAEPIKAKERMGSRELEERVVDLLELTGLAREHLYRYPHEFSGGQRQRIAIARAIATRPELIVFDEPTSALDVSVQSQILELLKTLQERFNMTYLFVTHHLLVVRYISQRTAVMYLGKIMEVAGTKKLFSKALHPYTHALISGIPVPEVGRKKQRIVLTGDVPSPVNPPEACRFNTRCPFVLNICREVEPPLEEAEHDTEDEHLVACHRKHEVEKLVFDRFGRQTIFPVK